MASANDNFEIRDGLANLFKMRSKDVSLGQDGSLQVVRHLASQYPVDYGIGGCYQLTSTSGVMTAGLVSGSEIYAFRWISTAKTAILRRLRISAYTQAGFTAGLCAFYMYRVTSWTVADSGGVTDTITGGNGSMRSAMPSSSLAEIRHSSTGALSPGTRTPDAQPTDNTFLQAPTTANTVICNRQTLFDRGDHPLVMAQNEGFIVNASVPGTGTWVFSITPEWDEVSPTNY